MSSRVVVRWILAFVGASTLLVILQPVYIDYLLGSIAVILVDLVYGAETGWSARLDGMNLQWTADVHEGRVGLRIASYNLALYLTAILAVAQVDAFARARWCATGLVVLFLWQLGDVLLTVESQWLTLARPDAYDMAGGVDVWFLMVKFANNLNVLAGRQLIPFAIVGLQWWRSRATERAPLSGPFRAIDGVAE